MLYQKQSKTGDLEHVKGAKSRALNQKQPVTAVPGAVAKGSAKPFILILYSVKNCLKIGFLSINNFTYLDGRDQPFRL